MKNARARVREAETRQQWAWEHAAEVYLERDLLIGVLTHHYPSHLMKHTHHRKLTVCIHTPAGQLAWTVSESLKPLVCHLAITENDWDKAKVIERHDRLRRLALKT
jgi:hypothetical protein